jgi:Flp pilus assembly secretin CpaC
MLKTGATLFCLAIATIAGPALAETPAEKPLAQPGAEDNAEAVIVTVDRARVFRVPRPAATVIIGNPSIADATIEDERTLVLTGRSFGVTNLIILDADGNPIVDQTVVVRGHETNTVRIYRRSMRETLACAPVCEPTLTIGDNAIAFAFANEQIKARNDLSDASAK